MKIIAPARELANAVEQAATLADGDKSKVPAFAAAHLVAGDGKLAIIASNRNASLSVGIEAQGEGEVAVPARQLAELTKHFGKTEVTISVSKHAATVVSGKSCFRLPVIPIKDMPPPLALDVIVGQVNLDIKAARDLFKRPAYAISGEPARFYLCGLLLQDREGGLLGVAADGYHLARVTIPTATSLSKGRTLIVPGWTVKIVRKLLSDVSGAVTLRRSERLFELSAANVHLVSRLIDASYPEYERTIAAAEGAITVNRAELIEAVARFAAINDPKMPAVVLAWNKAGELHLSARDGSEDLLVGEAYGAGATTLQTMLLAEALDELRGERVRLTAGAVGSPIRISDPADGSFLALIALFRGWTPNKKEAMSS
jgi:DNA polymerase-3 subunit beta